VGVNIVLMVFHAMGNSRMIGWLFCMAGTISLNHNTNNSIIALTKACPVGPYAMHSAEYLHLPFRNPAALAAAISICCHSLYERPDGWKPQVGLS